MFINSNDSNRSWPIVDLNLDFIILSFENTRSHVTCVDGIVRITSRRRHHDDTGESRSCFYN